MGAPQLPSCRPEKNAPERDETEPDSEYDAGDIGSEHYVWLEDSDRNNARSVTRNARPPTKRGEAADDRRNDGGSSGCGAADQESGSMHLRPSAPGPREQRLVWRNTQELGLASGSAQRVGDRGHFCASLPAPNGI
jgi:hypothetical protein